jgi:iron complex outermembrane recepter protein
LTASPKASAEIVSFLGEVFMDSICRRGAIVAALLLLSALPVRAQNGFITGKVTRDTGDPMAGAAVVVEELKRESRTGEDGTYRIENVPPGNYHVSVRAEGYSTRRTEVAVTPQGATLDLVVTLDLHFAEVVSVSPNARPQFESYQPTSVLDGQELQKQLETTIGATLQSQPGVAMRAFGPGPARPVIRGLDGDRVAVLQDGQRVGDLSSQSGDHGVTLSPLSATRIEVVRGPATLLYGANAIGGLVNMITDQIPTTPVVRPTGEFIFDAATNAGEVGGAGDVHFGNGSFAMHVGGGANRHGDFSTPDGEVENSQSESSVFNVGASWTKGNGYFGASYGFDQSEYGIPIVEEGLISLNPERHAFTIRAGGAGLGGAIPSYRATLGIRRYQHDELVGDEVGTHFDNDTEDAELMLSHRPFGRLSGTVGGSFLNRAFNAIGEEALAPPIDQRGGALFLYEELTWPHVTLQFGGRVDWTNFEPDSDVLPDRDFTEASGSVGLMLRPAAANDDVVIAMSLARAARNPALEELYFFGPHPGNFAFEIGNPSLNSEDALGFDLSLRARTNRVRGEFTVFTNSINDFIFRNPLTEEEFEAREEEFHDRFGVEEEEEGEGHSDEFPFVEFVAADSRLYGFEAHVDVNLTSNLIAELTYDMVRGELSDTDDPLPRIPPYRVIPGLRYQSRLLQVGGSVTITGDQNRVFGAETPTEGAGVLKLFGSYSFITGGVVNTITARLDNATDKLYRNHLNYLKDELPEMGRNFKVVYSVKF